MPPTRKLLIALAAASLLVTACGDDDEADDTASDDATATTRAPDTTLAGSAAGCGGIEVTGDVGESATISVPDDCDPTALQTVDLVEGDGDEVAAGATVTVHYAGVLLDGTQFDASYGGQPATFPLDGVIAGWTEGIPGMKVGGRRLLVIPSDLAYGPEGYPPVIPGDADLVFVVDLLQVP